MFCTILLILLISPFHLLSFVIRGYVQTATELVSGGTLHHNSQNASIEMIGEYKNQNSGAESPMRCLCPSSTDTRTSVHIFM